MDYDLRITEEQLRELDPVAAERIRSIALRQMESRDRHDPKPARPFETRVVRSGDEERQLAEDQHRQLHSNGIDLPRLQTGREPMPGLLPGLQQ